MLIRPAGEADFAAIYDLERACFADDSWSAEALRGELAAEHTSYFLAETVDGRVVGYAGLAQARGGEQADVQTIAVAAEERGQGLGARLMGVLLLQALAGGAAEVFLEVRADNPVAARLYRRLGFRQIDIRRRYYQPAGVDALVMRLRLAEISDQLDALARSGKRPPVVLGIESSCDETGVGIVRGNNLLANVVASSMQQHAVFGGVVPEIAARAHLEAIGPTLSEALATAGLEIGDIDAIAVTNGPGLAGALMVGVGAAKALAVATGKPIYAVNHLVGHVGVDVLDRGELQTPTIALLVSGGHTSLLLVRDLLTDVELLGETIDDAAGEAFDKVARVLGLAYPGGPEIDRAAVGGNPLAQAFPRGLTQAKDLAKHRYDFSFSGLKTAVARHVESARARGEQIDVADVAASFREAVVDVLVSKAVAACRDHAVPRLLLGGGVVANARLRELAAERCAAAGIELRIPPFALCTDNGAMIAALGAQLIAAGHPQSGLEFGCDSTLPVTSVQAF